jgi:nitrite reductase (NADH) large subunit
MQFVVQQGADSGRAYEIVQGKFTIGRLPTNFIKIDDPQVSRWHVEIELTPGGLVVRDNKSANGTLVNGAKISASYLMKPNDLLQVGKTVLRLVDKDGLPPRPVVVKIVAQPALVGAAVGAPAPEVPVNAPVPLVNGPAPAVKAPGPSPIHRPGLPPLNRVVADGPKPAPVPAAKSPAPAPFKPPVAAPLPAPAKPAPPPVKVVAAPKPKVAGPVFPNYLQMRTRVPMTFWYVCRVISVLSALTVAVLLFVKPDVGLAIFFKFFIPVLPLVFFIAPGLWRNVCPMAALNQTPRLFKFTRALTLPPRLKEYGYVIGLALFLAIVPSRKVLFNENGLALGILVLGSLLTAFTMGTIFKGKSGWCSSMCPLLPVQRIYGQTPFVTVPNGHCRPCVGCTKNCYDFNPAVAYLADLNDKDRHYSGYRKFFAGVFPGLVLAFYTVPNPPAISAAEMYLQFLLYMGASLGLFFFLDSFVKVTANKITALFAAAALNIYYWFNFPLLADNIGQLFKFKAPEAVVWTAQAALLLVTLVWVVRTYRKEVLFLAQATAPKPARAGSSLAISLHRASRVGSPEVIFKPENRRVVTKPETTILEVCESSDLRIEAGCRMGMCGADPVAILEGMDNLSAIGDDERTTLERLGFADNTRMACCARVRGQVTVSLKPEQPKQPSTASKAFQFDPSVNKIVIIGNGIAGVTAADHIRRRHPRCEIHLVAREEHHLYNRMGISRLIYGRSAMQGLYLMAEPWYDERLITYWLNTIATRIDVQNRQVVLETGETLPYDRLILAMGSSSTVPAIEGYGLPGSFVLREAADAMKMRAFAQEQNCRHAVVAGGGLLGLEAAYALHKLGLHVTVLERGKWLLRRQLDRRAGQLLGEYLQGLGMEILHQAEVAGLKGTERVEQVTTQDGRTVNCDLFLVAAGITPNVELARAAGLKVNKGVLVDDYMRTSVPGILAAGDVAEFRGEIHGLWVTAVGQAEAAAINAIGGNKPNESIVPVTALKVVGIELTSIGGFEAESDEDMVIALEEVKEHRYRKLVISDGKIAGAILLGYQTDASTVTAAVKKQANIAPYLNELRAGNWQVLNKALS